MTTRALVKDHPWSHEKARAGTVNLAVAAQTSAGDSILRALPEHLVRRSPNGDQRSVRILFAGDGDPGDLTAWRFSVQVAGHGEVPVEVIDGPEGSVRLLLPVDPDRRDVRIEARRGDTHATLEFALEPPRDWTIHLVHHSHLDIGYTDPQGTVLSQHVAFLDSCLDLTRTTDDWPDDARFRWAVESLWSFEQWAAARPAERVAEFIERVRAGQIELTAMPYNLHSDTCSTEELHELFRLARQVRETYGIDFQSAMQTDVPGAVAGLPDALGEYGVKYLSVAHNWAGRSVPNVNGGSRLPRLFRWRAPSGKEVLVWMTDSPHGLAYMEGPVLGFDTSYEMVDDLLPAYLTSLATRPYPFPPGMFGWHGPAVEDRDPYPWDVLHLRVQGHFGDNAPPRLILAENVRRWNETWASPRLRLSTNTDFFRDAEARLGDRIPAFEGDWGDWWVEGVGSGARPQAMVRRAQATVTDAESLYGLATVVEKSPHPEWAQAARGSAASVYHHVSLFNEHTWGASNSWTHGDSGMNSGEQQWHWKYGQALHGNDNAETFLDQASATLGGVLPEADGADVTFWAVNTTPAARTSIVKLFVRESRVPLDRPLSVTDGRTGAPLAAVEKPQVNPTHRDAGRFLRVEVPDVPAFGLVRLDVTSTAPTRTTSAERSGLSIGSQTEVQSGLPVELPTAKDLLLENDHLRVQVDLRRACIASVIDKSTGRELVDQEAVVGFNGYVYDTYTTAGGYNHHSNRTSVSDELELLGSRRLAQPAVLVERVDNAIEQKVTFEYPADGVNWARTTVQLGRHAAHVEIDNRFDKPATMTKESAYLSFPFAMEQPTVHYEISGALTGSGLEHVPGAPQHMRAVRSFVSLEDAEGAVGWVTRDAPLVEPETIALPYAPFPDSTAPRQPGTIYSWVHNNLWDTNFPAQQAFEATFRYAVGVRRAGEDLGADALALRTAYEIDHPLVGVCGQAEPRPDQPAQLSLLGVDDPRVTVLAVMPVPAEDDAAAATTDLLVRLQSYATTEVTVRLRCGFGIEGASRATFLGDTTGTVEVDGSDIVTPISRLGVTAVRIRLADR
ncbi:glycoside hydrolase family 38 C-terminal domain-containing protein [Actinopolymorpha pittospori]|uniref:Alpha-mannosidase n=1 Tax=Actinopolymorpha pittospori TaxID=648752 RepID=A0A927MXJ2_9ACTN|nr:glycoside hydrolase family 38 C-terminal domain-containing protein [Actinopolymorpha pittospori]MBE1608321.1 hypothetical protein [Actinopolymorpha pittospori]